MAPREQQKAVADTVCRNGEAWRSGVVVNFECGGERDTLCCVAFYSQWLKSWTTMKYQHFHNAHFEAALGSIEEIYRRLEGGDRGRTVIAPLFYKGLPIRDNSEILAEEAARKKAETLAFSPQKAAETLCIRQRLG